MGAFTDSIVVELFPGEPYPYGIHRGFEFHSGRADSGLFVRCKAGFRYDGTSIPWALRWLISPNDPELLQCAAIHDKIYRTGTMIIRVGEKEQEVPVHRDVANAMMAEAMKALKVTRWKQSVINFGLAVGSGPAWRKTAKKRASSIRTDTTQ